MLAPAPLGHTEGILTKAHIVVPYVMSENGAGISVSNEVWSLVKPKFPILQTDGFKSHPASDFIDVIAYDGYKPNEHLSKFAIGRK